jgi:hypothetical protein
LRANSQASNAFLLLLLLVRLYHGFSSAGSGRAKLACVSEDRLGNTTSNFKPAASFDDSRPVLFDL